MLKKIGDPIKYRCLPYVIAYLGRFLLWILMRTCRFEICGLERYIETTKQFPCILMLWHNRLATVPAVLKRKTKKFIYTTIVSKSRDVDALAILTNSYRNGRVIRVPHNARAQALTLIINRLKKTKEIIVMTPDGPRGPFHVVKPGIVFAAYHAEAKIIPYTWDADRSWILKTKDRMVIPKPFSKIKVAFGEPVSIGTLDMETETAKLRDVMFALQASFGHPR